MKKITNQSIMEVKDSGLFLHGNRIAYYENGNLYITNCGWFSNTTKERLNALPNVSINQNKGVWYLNGEVWNGEPVKIG